MEDENILAAEERDGGMVVVGVMGCLVVGRFERLGSAA
jgi:hypothetical protein